MQCTRVIATHPQASFSEARRDAVALDRKMLSVQLNDGRHTMPLFGLGTAAGAQAAQAAGEALANGKPSPVSEQVKEAVKEAIACGYLLPTPLNFS